MPTCAQWSEWQSRCAVAKCGLETAAALRLFGWQRLRHYARAVPGGLAAGNMLPDAAACWHLLETRLATGRTRQGCCYKQWLFARTADATNPLDAIQGGASLLMRDVTREFLRRECPPPQQVSLDAPIPNTEGRLVFADLLPDQSALTEVDMDDAVVSREIAQSFFEALAVNERVVLLARQLEIPLSHPAVEQASGMRRSGLYKLWRAIHLRLAAVVDRAQPDEDRPGRLQLALRAARHLGDLAFSWGRVEKATAHLFIMAGR